MKVGTKSVLFGAHCFFLHPWFVAAAWWKLYGFPFDLRLWVAFFCHDLGYLGKPNMDGPEGETHPESSSGVSSGSASPSTNSPARSRTFKRALTEKESDRQKRGVKSKK